MSDFSPTLQRVATFSALCLLFIAMASVFSPRGSDAVPPPERTPPQDEALSRSFPEAAPPASLGDLIGRKYVLRIHAGEPALYSVYTLDGLELGALLTAQEVREHFADLPIDDLMADDSVSAVDPSAAWSDGNCY